ncbi:MAG: hypothetical protein MHPSP_002847 [Paramarteilia canceri]
MLRFDLQDDTPLSNWEVLHSVSLSNEASDLSNYFANQRISKLTEKSVSALIKMCSTVKFDAFETIHILNLLPECEVQLQLIVPSIYERLSESQIQELLDIIKHI